MIIVDHKSMAPEFARPLGAVVGDFLDKPVAQGGLELSRAGASVVLGIVILTLILALPQRAAAAEHGPSVK